MNVQFIFLQDSGSNARYPRALPSLGPTSTVSNCTYLTYSIRLCNQLIVSGLCFSNQCTYLIKIQIL